ncbi:GFA family protein [uncultured Kiloniella sp.]|uniref:GFA family protein n=1 Tax=uncultured Kiloniella sp. TaxID=1133091 RepID=UPI002629C549|nr:GFA family protein [uncultured Kiloniella sp.]
MTEIIEGGCLCGQVRYQTSCIKPLFKVNCHCRDCQKLSGSPYVAVMGVPETSFSVTGDLNCFEHQGGSGGAMKSYCCSKCNSRIYGTPEIAKGMVLIVAMSLDNPDFYSADADMFVKQAVSWDMMNSDIPKFDGSMFQRGG